MWHKHSIRKLQMEFQTFDVSICNGNEKHPIWTLTFYTDFSRSSSFMFPLLLLTKEVQNTVCNSLLPIVTTSWPNLNKIGWPELHQILIFWQKTCQFYYVKHFWNIACAILKEVLQVKHLMMFMLFIIRLLSFIIPKITEVRHLKPS